MDLLNFQGATSASSVAMLGVSLLRLLVLRVILTRRFLQAFYGCAGIGLYIACIMEWLIGNTFPCVVFGTFGARCVFVTSYAADHADFAILSDCVHCRPPADARSFRNATLRRRLLDLVWHCCPTYFRVGCLLRASF